MTGPPMLDPQALRVVKTVDFDKMRVFSGHPETHSVHTNRRFARDRGLPDAVAQGLQTYAYMCEWLVTFFGQRWFTGGHLAVSFLSIVLPGDVITTRAALVPGDRTTDPNLVTLEIWCEKELGVKVAAGIASAPVR